MRTTTFISGAFLPLAIYASPSEPVAGPVTWDQAPQGERIIPRLDRSEPIDGAKRVEKLYGPYTVPASQMIRSGNTSEAPCTNCYVTAMFATLKYADGKEATTQEGVWLHHITLGSSRNRMIWAAGNERPTIRLNSQYKYGIEWGRDLNYRVDINNENKEPLIASLSITFEYVTKDGEIGKQYKPSVMKWIQMSPGEQPKPGKKTYKSREMSSDINGKLLYTIGHMHDGGTNLRLFINNQPACNSIMYYDGGDKGLVKASDWAVNSKSAPNASRHVPLRRSPQEGGHGHMESMDGPHIASPGACTNYGSVREDDVMRIEAYYDFDRFKMQEHAGKKEALMGNCRVYIGPD